MKLLGFKVECPIVVELSERHVGVRGHTSTLRPLYDI